MKEKFPLIKAMGDRAILIEFSPEIDVNLLEKIIFYKEKLQEFYIGEKVEVTNTYSSLLIFYHFNIENIYGKVSAIKEAFSGANIVKNPNPPLFRIPVCYEDEFGWDLDLISREKELSKSQIIELHTSPAYTIFFIGFLPGFLYLGGLDEKLKISRKSSPRLEVEKGAVGIGENQTGIYPKKSPGGWQIIGNSPLSFFDKSKNPPSPFSPGNRVRFFPVSKPEYFKIQKQVIAGNYKLEMELYDC